MKICSVWSTWYKWTDGRSDIYDEINHGFLLANAPKIMTVKDQAEEVR
jgi:hypothetical protein